MTNLHGNCIAKITPETSFDHKCSRKSRSLSLMTMSEVFRDLRNSSFISCAVYINLAKHADYYRSLKYPCQGKY